MVRSFRGRCVLAAGLLLPAVGCETRLADFTAMSTKNILAKNVDVRALPKVDGVEAEKVSFLGIGANVKDPLDEALEKGKGNLMINAVVYVKDYVIFSGYRVRGTVVNVP